MNQIISAIIPCHNNAETIKRAVDSAYENGCNRVMVCDDASTDNSKEVIDTLYNYHGRNVLSFVYFWNHTRYGASVTRNKMIESPLCEGLTLCLDADDTLCDIVPLVAAWQPNNFVYGNHNEIQGDTVTQHKGAPIGTLPNKMVTGVTFLLAKEDWLKVGGFDPDFAFAEDYAFQCALVNAGVQGTYVDTTVYNRYIRPDGNERSVLAGEYWNFYHTMARRKFPNVFNGSR